VRSDFAKKTEHDIEMTSDNRLHDQRPRPEGDWLSKGLLGTAQKEMLAFSDALATL